MIVNMDTRQVAFYHNGQPALSHNRQPTVLNNLPEKVIPVAELYGIYDPRGSLLIEVPSG